LAARRWRYRANVIAMGAPPMPIFANGVARARIFVEGARQHDKKVMNVNASRLDTSGRIQPALRKFRVTIGVPPYPSQSREKSVEKRHPKTENTMLRKFAGVLLATALLAGPAFATQPTDNAGPTSAAATAGHHAASKHLKLTKHRKTVTHARKHAHKHAARGRLHKMKDVRHVRPTTKHKAHVAKAAKADRS
jgi:hypothetical protein